MKLIGRNCPLAVCLIVMAGGGASLSAQQAPAAPPAKPDPQAAPAQEAPARQAPAPQQEPENLDRMLSVAVYDWVPYGGSFLRGGAQGFVPPSHDLDLPRNPSRAYGAVVTLPMKGNTRLEVSYLTVNDSGNALAPTDLGLFGGNIAKDEPLFMKYSLRQIKFSWNYLTYPNPPQDSKFRVKTLWEFHYIQLKPSVTLTVTAPDQPLNESQRILMPAAGLGMEYVPSRHFRIEARGSGMGFPSHPAVGDGDVTVVGRIRKLEIFAGGKALYFRTSPQKETFIKGFLWGPYGGLRWVF